MTNLIEISKTQIGGAEINSVNARNLHEKLQSKQDFSTWIKKRLDDTQAVENYDFTSFHKKNGARNFIYTKNVRKNRTF